MSRRVASAHPSAGTGGIGAIGRVTLALLRRARIGTLTIRWPNGSESVFGGALDGPNARVTVAHTRALRRAALGGSTGLAEAYMDGDWDSPDLTAILEFAQRNVDLARDAGLSLASPLTPVNRVWHRVRDNTKRGSRRNILAHYDLGNDFYTLWLDPDLTYSCGIFDGTECDLAEAQRRKWDRLLDLIDPQPGSTLLEIGCGWGGFAVHAAKTRGVKVTGVTISDEQLAHARARVAAEGLEGVVELRLQDYREIDERFDAVASIEMFEAVGERWWPTFFAKLRDCLAPGGRAALQVITIEDQRFAGYRAEPDFTQRYIFPGGMLPSPGVFREVARSAGLACGEPHFFGQDYALTLRMWEERFASTIQAVRSLGFDERFERMWRFYLAYCQAGFRTGSIDVMQIALEPSG